jgi:tetratricopeptide (TPR) repeat protein
MNGQQKGSGYFLNGKIDGLRKLYYADGKLSDEITYKGGVSHGLEQRYHKNGNLSQKGNFEYGKEVGIWESYHVNGTLKQRSNYDRGTLNGKAESFYSTGTLRSAENYITGVPSDKKNKKLGEKYNQGIAADRQADFKLSIKKYTECLEIEPSFADAFYARGTAKLNDLDFDGALQDFNKALEIEPSFMQVYGNRAFALLRKHEFKNSRKINTDKDFTVLAVTSTAIPAADLEKICLDLTKSIELGDTTQMTKDVHEKYCKSK